MHTIQDTNTGRAYAVQESRYRESTGSLPDILPILRPKIPTEPKAMGLNIAVTSCPNGSTAVQLCSPAEPFCAKNNLRCCGQGTDTLSGSSLNFCPGLVGIIDNLALVDHLTASEECAIARGICEDAALSKNNEDACEHAMLLCGIYA